MRTIHIHTPDQKAAALEAYVQARELTIEEWFLQIAEHAIAMLSLEASTQVRRKHISEVIRDIFSNLPEEARAKLPVDGAAQVDHYVYGLPKRAQMIKS